MEQTIDRYNPAELTAKKENTLLGIIGALLFSLAGVVVHFLLSMFGYIASLSGFVAIAAAFFGYGLFSGNKRSIRGVVIAAVAAVLAMLAANYLYSAYDLLKVVHEDGLDMSFWDALRQLPSLIGGEELVIPGGFYEHYYTLDGGSFWKDVLISILFCGLGAFGFISSTVKKIKAERAEQAASAAAATIPEDNAQ